MSKENHLLLWMDVETDGVSLQPPSHLLSVAGVLTTSTLQEVSPYFEHTLHYSYERAQALRAAAPEVVRKMHDRSGLWEELPQGEAQEAVDDDLSSFLTSYGKDATTIRLAGSSPRLDLTMTELYLPKTYSKLHYRFVDVSGMAFLLEQWGRVPGYYEKKKLHTAREDIQESLEELRWLAKEGLHHPL